MTTPTAPGSPPVAHADDADDSATCRCGAAPTAFKRNTVTSVSAKCLSCAAVDRYQLEPLNERNLPLPEHLQGTPIALIHPRDTVWNHQAIAVDHLRRGANVVVATPTASGKTLIFHLHTLAMLHADPQAATLVMYPAKALANDQLLRWKQSAETAGFSPGCVQQITDDVPMRHRQDLLRTASIVLMTPDVVHAWLIRSAANPQVSAFLRRLRLIITDEAHVYEDVLGTNAAFMFRRLQSAVRASGNPDLPQYLAATATIQFPDKHMETLTGHPFIPLEADDNGAPRHPTQLLHIPPPTDDESLESVAAKMITSIIDNDPNAQLIVFHDSRQGAERIAAHTHRRSQVTPYRAGYLPQERREIEDKLRANTIRAIVSTSALEVGIDMPDLNYAINIGLPPTRKQLHQRLGRVGRTRPATFIILADHRIFQRHNESLTHYYRNSVEPSRLHMDNTYIAYQHALCYQQENRGPARNTGADLDWPPSFTDALAMIHDANPPRDLAHVRARSNKTPPQIAYSLRSTGEESLDIIPSIDGADAPAIGSINPPTAISEVFPGALYRHNGRTYQAREWRRRQGKPYVRIVPNDAAPSTSTRPMLRKVAIANPRSTSHSALSPGPHPGGYAHVTMTLWTSTEGFVTRTGGSNVVTNYADMPPGDPLSRKTVSMPTSGFLLYIDAPWMSSDEEDRPTGRNEIANLLAHELSYQHSVALPNLGSITSNILTTTPQGDPYLLENALAVYDNIHGGLGLTLPLARDITRIIPKVTSAPSSNPQLFLLLKRWLDTATEPFEFPQEPGPAAWWRTFPDGALVQFPDPSGRSLILGHKLSDVWYDRPLATILLPTGETTDVPIALLQEQHPSANWLLWRPSSHSYRPLPLQ